MVLWEITLGTAYFLGLKRTYRLALKIQRNLIKRPAIRQFLHRRTRTVFDGAVSVYRTIQERDIEVGRNLGNRILRWLDRMKPEAQIRGQSPPPPKINSNTTNQLNNQPKPTDKKSDRHLFTASRSILPKNPTIAMMMQPARSIGHNTQYRQYGAAGLELFSFGPTGVLTGVCITNILQDLRSKKILKR
ncbi:uncharacterized protein LOC125218427 [Salvia hispanica]|uniref:uncharacterized protein LOC125218427 n=1 Tax=Salvia hispanica TaxID=49212 RepID=UPI0020096ACE|nr:uncharacterized protein LOC125218427 [Salvia hispanica]